MSDSSSNKTTLIITIGIIGSLLFIAIASYISAYNYGNKMDQQIKAKYQDMEVTLANASQKVADLVQIPDLYKKDAVELIKAEMSGRYGANGSSASIQFFQEKGIQLDPTLYRRIQQEIVVGRNEFTGTQKQLITIKQSYQEALGSFWKGMWLGIAGYPKINLDDFKIISSDHAQGAFKSGVDNGFIKH